MWKVHDVRKNYKIVMALPVYEAERILERTLYDMPSDWVDEIFIVDDASSDGTVAAAHRLELHPIIRARHTGYGGNQGTCGRPSWLFLAAPYNEIAFPIADFYVNNIPELRHPIFHHQFKSLPVGESKPMVMYIRQL